MTQLAAVGLILIMLSAIYKKIFAWHTGFWGEKTYGWHLRLDVRRNESGHHLYQWRPLYTAALVFN
jgi:hypothetical protein